MIYSVYETIWTLGHKKIKVNMLLYYVCISYVNYFCAEIF